MSDLFVQLYPVESGLKLAFIGMSLFNLDYSITLAVVISLLGLLRMLKMPQFSREYLTKAIQNNNGQNLLYIGMGWIGGVQYLFYAPLALYFAYGLVEYVNLKWSNTSAAPKYMPYVAKIRDQRFYIMEGKGKLEIVYWIFSIMILPINLTLMQGCKIFMLGQFLMTKYRLSTEFRYSVASIDSFFDEKTKILGILNMGYKKLTGLISKAMQMTEPEAPRPE